MGVTANFQMNGKFRGTKPLAEDGGPCVPRGRCASPASWLACCDRVRREQLGLPQAGHTALLPRASLPRTSNAEQSLLLHMQIVLSCCLEGDN